MKYSILLGILFDLLVKRKMTAPEIAEKYNLSVRTVYRYVDDLTLGGVPVTIERGRSGGICISDTYKLPMNFMTAQEYESAIEALEAMYTQLPEERFVRAKNKLSAQLKTEKRELTLSGNLSTILVDGGTWGDTRRFSDKMRLMEHCVRESAVLNIEYDSRVGEHTRRKIEPHLLVYKQSVWYIYAFCRNQRAFRLFRLGRISKAVLTDEKFIRRPFSRDDIPLNYWTDSETVDVRIEIEKSAFADAQDWLGGENLKQTGEKWLAEVTLPNDEVLVKKIMALGGGAKVLSPFSLAEKVRASATELLKAYE
ncbi:MAG: YafY family transcriptional regulator [Clostridia bacterium]|nr:YafY family transcriptional regulator [Clostridia bacterium]